MNRWLLVCLSLLARDAFAAQVRYALLVGAHAGSSGEVRLRYAGDDVANLRETLTTVGGFLEENVTTLTDPSGRPLDSPAAPDASTPPGSVRSSAHVIRS